MFGRVAKLQIGSTEFEGLRVRFSVRRAPGKLDGAQIDVWGLDLDAYGQIGRSTITTRLICGYRDDGVGVIVEGTTTPDSLQRPVADGEVVTSWQVQEAGAAMRSVRLAASWPGQVTADEVIRYVAGELGVAVAPVVLPRTPTYARGFAVNGAPRLALSTLAADCGCSWSLQAGRLVLTPLGGVPARVRAVVVQPVGTPQSMDRGRVEVVSLLLPGTMPGDAVRVAGDWLAGDYVVEQLEHRGDTHAEEWFTTLTVRPRA